MQAALESIQIVLICGVQMDRRSFLLGEVLNKYGFVLTRQEAEEVLKIGTDILQAIPDSELPRVRFGGRGGHRFLAIDIVQFLIERTKIPGREEALSVPDVGAKERSEDVEVVFKVASGILPGVVADVARVVIEEFRTSSRRDRPRSRAKPVMLGDVGE